MTGRRKPIATAIAAAIAILATTTGLTWVAAGTSNPPEQNTTLDLQQPFQSVALTQIESSTALSADHQPIQLAATTKHVPEPVARTASRHLGELRSIELPSNVDSILSPSPIDSASEPGHADTESLEAAATEANTALMPAVRKDLPAGALAAVRPASMASGTGYSASGEPDRIVLASLNTTPGAIGNDFGYTSGAANAATSYESFDLDPSIVEVEWNTHEFALGENMSTLWTTQWSLPNATLYRLLADRENKKILSRLRPGQKIEWKVDEKGYLEHLRIWDTRGAGGNEWVRQAEGWDFDRHKLQSERKFRHRVIHATLDGSVSRTLHALPNLSSADAAHIAVLIERHVPVRTRARDGDRISLLLEYETLPDEFEALDRRLLAFRYEGTNIKLDAARYLDNRFYTSEGESLLPPFDRRPFAGSHRISSAFNPRRRHPVTGNVAPHNGTDFAMPVGTPINAPANGRVTRVENHPYAGRWIEIQHGQGYSTRYLHLSRPQVRVGQQVTRGDQIALSGNTGRSTGPHLHYELHVNSRPVDAMRAELPASENLAAEDLPLFHSIYTELFAQIDESSLSRIVAMRPFATFAE